MPTNEKEINNYLFDQLTLVERIEEVAKKTNAKEVVEFCEKEKVYIERKLYQNPPLTKAGE